MNVVCRFCKDLRSESESASLCCRTEKVKLPSENPFPDIISNHLNSEEIQKIVKHEVYGCIVY